MKYRRLGRTGLGVSPICLGTMGFGPPTTQKQVTQIVKDALDLGINFIDTANCYDGPNRGEYVEGKAESMLCKALAGKRDEFVIQTKAATPMRPGPQHRGLSATHLIRELDGSLKRLGTDWVDVFMIHHPDQFADVEEVVRAVDTIIRSGRARYFGVSNHQGWQVCEYLWAGDARNWAKVGVSEINLSILERRFENDLAFYEKHEIGVTPYSVVNGGRLSGKFRKGQKANEQKPGKIAGFPKDIDAATQDKIEALAKLSDELDVSLAQYAMAWVLRQPAISSLVIGARDRAQLEAALAATKIEIPAEHLEKIDAIAPGPAKPVPRFER